MINLRASRYRKQIANASQQGGFTLIEIMITLALGLIISTAIIQVMASNSVTERLNRAVASTQESGRFIINRMRNELFMVGMYDELNPLIDNLGNVIDLVEENQYVRAHPVILQNEFAIRPTLGSKQGIDGGNDTLVVSLLAARDCRGYQLGYPDDALFYAVNEYFVQDKQLKCRGFDGRYLRGQKDAVGHNSHAAFTLLDDVERFQVTYGLSSFSSSNGTARPIQFVDASALQDAFASGQVVVALRIALVVKSDAQITVDSAPTFKLLNEDSFSTSKDALYKSFETTITLRNMKNYVRSGT